ncbi:MAG: hypothetical protein J6D27_00680 [Ruminiclostridium sp.]|nr:hypothetical protein [Ruminiclostridium sp.]
MREIYTDEKCPVCGVAFKESDDIVVCPDCGTPYHRDCYKEQSECVFSDRHGSYEWKGEKQMLKERYESIHTEKMRRLSNTEDDELDMKNINTVEELREAMDQRLLRQQKDFPEVDGVDAEELVKFCGKNAAYYLPVFRDIINKGQILKLNFSAFIFFPLHCFFRRMNLFGALILFLIMLTMEARILIADTNNILGLAPEMAQLLSVLSSAAMLAILVFVLMFFNFFYFRFAVKKIKNVKSENASYSRREVLHRISEAGRPSLFSGLAFGVCAVIALSFGFQVLNNYLGVVV